MSQHEPDPNASPVNPLPPMVVALALAIFAIEVIFQAGNAGLVGGPEAIGWRSRALENYGFYEPIFDWMVQNRSFRWDYAMRLVTYPFVHGSFTHMIFALVFILALGKMVGEVFSAMAVLVIFFGASVVGAVAYGLAWDTRILLFGAFPAAYGLIGAFSYMLWTRLAGTEENRFRAFSLIGFLMGLQLLWGLIFGSNGDWVADLAGFFTGFALSFVVSPGGWKQLVAAMRQR
ncbi:MAG TPA: rhomboid family intramembrane serine protease [Rhodobacteraceae bacterium]|nr:rhomboid family intramembrane serine protease [Paracoccaceae bacterium]